MSKLFNLKEWLTVSDTTKRLAIMFGEEVTEADVLRLALDGRLRLSVYFVNHTKALYGKLVPISDAEYEDVPSLDGSTTVRLYKGPTLLLGGEVSHVLELGDEVLTLKGVFDLPMIGNEQLDIEHRYHYLTGGPAVTLGGLDGAFVEGKNGAICQLLDHSDDNKYICGSRAHLEQLNTKIASKNIEQSEVEKLLNRHTEDRNKLLEKWRSRPASENFYPSGSLPEDSVLVVRTEALREFEQSVNGPPNKDKPMTTTERNTWLTIIAALCDYSAIRYQERGAAPQIAAMTDEIGASVSDDTIRKVLEKIPDALERRKK